MIANVAEMLFGQRRMKQALALRPRGVTLPSLLMMMLYAASLVYDRSLTRSTLQLDDMAALSLRGRQRLLVIAPHPDDETLGAAGAIQAALAAGAEVRVVIMTNGDGQPLAPAALRRRILARPADYIFEGEQRQAETVASMAALGVPEEDVIFLGYPDSQLNSLWLNNWTRTRPLRARYTRSTTSPYQHTFNREATYCGQDLLADLQSIIGSYRPDLILTSHPNDDHRDHTATSNFTRMAVALESAVDPDYRPDVWAYLIHYGYYPQPRGLRLQEPLLPPAPLATPEQQWGRLDLTTEQRTAKLHALRAHRSQMLLLGAFLPSFARPNELYAPVPSVDLSTFALVDIVDEISPDGEAIHQIVGTTDESNSRRLISGADLTSLQLIRADDYLRLTAETRGALLPGLQYRLMVKLPDGQTLMATLPGTAERTGRSSFTYAVSVEELGESSVLGIAAEVRRGKSLAHTGWQIVNLQNGWAR